jgi:hypothetical protein
MRLGSEGISLPKPDRFVRNRMKSTETRNAPAFGIAELKTPTLGAEDRIVEPFSHSAEGSALDVSPKR